MVFFFDVKSKNKNCINGCKIFSDKSSFSYWEDKKTTSDELNIVNYLLIKKKHIDKKILHIGIGNSYVANILTNYLSIDGVTISMNEIQKAKSYNLKNYNLFLENKLSNDIFFKKKPNYYDIIIDTNLKSFSCCQYAFDNLMKIYSSILSNNGFIISSFKGMNWSRIIKPIYSFSLSKLFYKRLKEFDGPISNILSFNECKKVCSTNNLDLTYFEGLIILSKQ